MIKNTLKATARLEKNTYRHRKYSKSNSIMNRMTSRELMFAQVISVIALPTCGYWGKKKIFFKQIIRHWHWCFEVSIGQHHQQLGLMCHVYARSTYLWVFLDYHPTVLNCLWFLWLMEADILLACENWRWPRKKKKKSNNWILRPLLLSLPFLLPKGLQMFTYPKQQTHWLGQQDNELLFFLAKWSTVVANTREKEHVKTLAIYLEHSPWFAPRCSILRPFFISRVLCTWTVTIWWLVHYQPGLLCHFIIINCYISTLFFMCFVVYYNRMFRHRDSEKEKTGRNFQMRVYYYYRQSCIKYYWALYSFYILINRTNIYYPQGR